MLPCMSVEEIDLICAEAKVQSPPFHRSTIFMQHRQYIQARKIYLRPLAGKQRCNPGRIINDEACIDVWAWHAR